MLHSILPTPLPNVISDHMPVHHESSNTDYSSIFSTSSTTSSIITSASSSTTSCFTQFSHSLATSSYSILSLANSSTTTSPTTSDIHSTSTIKRQSSTLPPKPATISTRRSRYAYASSIIAPGHPPLIPPLIPPIAPTLFTALCCSIHIPCLEEVLNEISVSSSELCRTDPATSDLAPSSPLSGSHTTTPIHLAYTHYHSGTLDGTLHTTHLAVCSCGHHPFDQTN